MLNRILGKFRLTPSVTLSLLALFVALGSSGWAANGGAFILGVINSATARTALVANFNGTALQLSNTSAGAAATALTLSVAAGHPPMKVNTVAKVTNLNADYLDGIDPTGLTRVRRIPFTLAAGASTAPITLPANLPVHVMGIIPGECVGQATILNVSGGLAWTGAGDCQGELGTTYGQANDVGHAIFFLYYFSGGGILLQLAAGGAILVKNYSHTDAYSGEITLVW